jgi:putative OPT family oligopeptide transporter
MSTDQKPGRDLREFTLRAVILGLIMTVVLGAANAYLGLKAGMTIAATYPAAVIGMAVLRLFKGSILEENMARTIGSIGESVAAGAIFTIPAFFIAGLWRPFANTEHFLLSAAVMFLGGVLGIMFVTILRRVMVEDESLPFPESVAAAEIHKAGRSGGEGAKTLFSFMGVGALVQICGAFSVFATAKTWVISMGSTSIDFMTSKLKPITSIGVSGSTMISSPQVAPAYLGVGFIIGPRLAALNFAGGVLAWGLFVPLLTYVLGDQIGGLVGVKIPEGEAGPVSWSAMSVAVWKSIVRPIAVGGMLVGAGFTLFKMRKSLGAGLSRAVGDLKKAAGSTAEAVEPQNKDLPFKTVFLVLGVTIILMVGLYKLFCGSLPGAIAAALVMAVTGFFFAAVSGFLVGTIGSSNNPISGLTLSTLIIAALLMLLVGVGGSAGVAAVLGVAAVVCVSSAVAGEMLQDLKVGHILGGTPWKMELGDIIGVFFAAAVLFFPLVALHQGDINLGGEGFGGRNLPAPQAGLMAMLAKGIIDQTMAWPLVIVGMLMGIAMIMVSVPSPMLVAVGMYLPMETTAAIFVGGLIRWIADRRAAAKGFGPDKLSVLENTGVLVAAGLIAGEALTGLFINALAFFNITPPALFAEPSFTVGVVVLVAIAFLMVQVPLRAAQKLK